MPRRIAPRAAPRIGSRDRLAQTKATSVRSAASGSLMTSALYKINPGWSATRSPAMRARHVLMMPAASTKVATASSAPTTAFTTAAVCVEEPKTR